MRVLTVFLCALILAAAESPVLDSRCPLVEDSINPTQLPFPNDCTKFYKCSGGYAYPVKCPPNLHWSVSMNRCEYPSVAGCDGSIPVSIAPEKKGIPMAACPPLEDPNTPTQLPFPGDCGKFYKCSAGYGFPISCPDGLHWSTALNRCDWPSVANCAGGVVPSSPPATTSTSTAAPAQNPNLPCPAVDDLSNPVQFPFPGDCGKYYKCLGGVAYPISCPAALQWSVSLNRCDWPTVANCVSVAPTSITPTPSPSISCPAVDDVNNPVQLPFPGDCGKFYKCLKGVAQIINCPTGLHWSTTLGRCEWPTLAKCDINAVTVPTTSTTESTTKAATPTPTPTNSWSGNPDTYCSQSSLVNRRTYISYPGDCQKFIQCSNGKGYIRSCVSGLFFNSKLVTCSRECA